MTRLNRNGFTLVELLVVITIISMLVGLLIPAVNMARARARQTQCMNNQHEIALAVLQYETAKNQFPGYVNKFGTAQTSKSDSRPPLSWTTVILPYIGNEAAWRLWRGKQRGSDFDDVLVKVPQYICPTDSDPKDASDSAPADHRLSYAANCGRQDNPPQLTGDTDNWDTSTPWDLAGNGVFHNRYACDKPVVTSSSIRDGASNTIMFSENIQAANWYAAVDASTITKLAANEFGLGIIWVTYNYATQDMPPDACVFINGCKDDAVSQPFTAQFARPSSNHPGGVVATMCDGHQRFLSERIHYLTYQHLMTPDSSKVGTVGATPTSLPAQPDDPELAVE